ncbi:unnamed protein product [Enterobius vermicularis]|uniref:S-adenosylmethionine decarboxylase proenzyme n=1 Tax=Enterobius vermicularis TaxID=51028 RepID=A0A0N4V352_ENTVE|nr:unnamed protein product [Enterobius vermicularis]
MPFSSSSFQNASYENISVTDYSSNALEELKDDVFFEGAEKVLEIWFDEKENGASSLRSIPFRELASMLEVAKCRILHSASNEYLDSYVLRFPGEASVYKQARKFSESSMFVFDFRLILKTCGSTMPLRALKRFLKLARRYCNRNEVIEVFYSHKNFMRPDRQPKPHQEFNDEAKYLDRYFQVGSVYQLGRPNQDQWYLYTMSLRNVQDCHPEHTLEILMTEMPDDILCVFSKAVCKDGKDCTEKSGIGRIMPFGTIIHEELFLPCGYSMNGLLPKTDKYITIHVTPEPGFSYASFETNQDSCSLYNQALQVVDTFKPRKFLVTVFSNDLSTKGKDIQQRLMDFPFDGYRRNNIETVKFEFESLIFAQFVRKQSVV